MNRSPSVEEYTTSSFKGDALRNGNEATVNLARRAEKEEGGEHRLPPPILPRAQYASNCGAWSESPRRSGTQSHGSLSIYPSASFSKARIPHHSSVSPAVSDIAPLNSPPFYPILTAVVLALLPGRDTVPLFGGIVKRRSSFDSSSRGLVSLSRRNDVRCKHGQQYPNHDDYPAQVSPKPMCVCIGQARNQGSCQVRLPWPPRQAKLSSWLLASTFCVNQHDNQQARSISNP